ncbi:MULTISPECIES: hypothetical protein [Burkholderia]|uniref:hypothetical protein n=1 Tax=Burkholderia TaxID=32008 RepID=UPI000A61C002|nr:MULTISPECIES: hypothetical protein [Burkholderia]
MNGVFQALIHSTTQSENFGHTIESSFGQYAMAESARTRRIDPPAPLGSNEDANGFIRRADRPLPLGQPSDPVESN